MNLLFNGVTKYNAIEATRIWFHKNLSSTLLLTAGNRCKVGQKKKTSLQRWISFSELARELDFTEEQIHQIRIENPNSLQDQSHALLKYWLERDGKHATGLLLVIVHVTLSSLLPEVTNVCYNHKKKIWMTFRL